MIASDQIKSIIQVLKTAKGQIDSVLARIDDPDQAQNVLIQIKAAQGLIDKAAIQLLDEAYRKALAERISEAADQCPGDCGNEAAIEHMLKIFPEIQPEEIPVKLMQIEKINKQLSRFISENGLEPPPRAVINFVELS